MHSEEIPLGPVDDYPIFDDFTFEEVVGSHCKAQVAHEVASYLREIAATEDKKFLPICVPCYNEEMLELLKTLISLLANFEFMQKKVSLSILHLFSSFLLCFPSVFV
jgi:hypothetical protein